jgi:hypothetical protein
MLHDKSQGVRGLPGLQFAENKRPVSGLAFGRAVRKALSMTPSGAVVDLSKLFRHDCCQKGRNRLRYVVILHRLRANLSGYGFTFPIWH